MACTDDHAGAALLRAQELGGAGDPEPPGAGGELERDARHGIRPGVVAAQPALGARAGHVGVEGEADGVEQAGLARAGGPVDEEEPLGRERVDVDDDPVGERPERLDLEPVHPHAAPTDPVATPSSSPTWRATRLASTASASSARSSSLAAAPAAHVAEEVAADLDVGRGGDPRGVRPQRHGGALRVEAQLEGEREPAAHLVHRPERPLRVGQGDLAPRGLGARRGAGSASSSSRVPRSTASGRCDRGLDVLDHRGVAGEVDEQAALAVRPLGERHRHRGAAVAHAGRDLLAAVQVPQGRVVDPGEHLRGHGATRRRR